MNPIELGKAIADIGVPVITAIMLILVVGLVWYLIRRQGKREDKQDVERTERQDKHDVIQKEERLFYRNLVTNDMKGLHQDSVKNAELNVQGLTLQKDILKDFREHNGHTREFSEKVIKSLNNVCEKLSIVGGRRMKNKPVKVERRI